MLLLLMIKNLLNKQFKNILEKLKFWLENTIQIKVNKKGSIWSNDQIESLLCIHNEYIERYLSLINNPGMVYNC